jgi:hypothetical protein
MAVTTAIGADNRLTFRTRCAAQLQLVAEPQRSGQQDRVLRHV